MRQRLLRVPDVTKADLIGVQDEKIYIEFSQARLAMLGIPVARSCEVVRRQNTIVAAGTVETKGERVSVRVDGELDSAERAGVPAVPRQRPHAALGDIAAIKRGYQRSAADLHALQGQAAIGLGVSMAQGGNVRRWARRSTR